jgi:hypothetical protein
MDTGVLKKLLGADSISSRWWKIDQKYFTDQIGIAPRNLYNTSTKYKLWETRVITAVAFKIAHSKLFPAKC